MNGLSEAIAYELGNYRLHGPGKLLVSTANAKILGDMFASHCNPALVRSDPKFFMFHVVVDDDMSDGEALAWPDNGVPVLLRIAIAGDIWDIV